MLLYLATTLLFVTVYMFVIMNFIFHFLFIVFLKTLYRGDGGQKQSRTQKEKELNELHF